MHKLLVIIALFSTACSKSSNPRPTRPMPPVIVTKILAIKATDGSFIPEIVVLA